MVSSSFSVEKVESGEFGSGLSGEERRAQKYMCTLKLRIKRSEERSNDKKYVHKSICAHCTLLLSLDDFR